MAGSLFVAYVLADKTGVLKKDAPGNAGTSWTRLGAIGMGKAVTEMGFDHVVANMFFRPLAVFEHAGDVTAAKTVTNLIFAFLGNAVGAALFVAGAYWYLYVRSAEPAGKEPAPHVTANGTARQSVRV